MKLLSGIKFVVETTADGKRVFKAAKVKGKDEVVLDLSALAKKEYKVVFEKEGKIFGRKADGREEEIDVSKFLA